MVDTEMMRMQQDFSGQMDKIMRMQRDLSRDLDTLSREENELRRDCETKIAWIREQRSALIKEYIDKLAEEDEHDQV